MERISGPYKGYFLAAYTVGTSPNFSGYAKICTIEPTNAWNATTVEKLASASGFHTEEEALAAVERLARHMIADIVGNWDQVSSPGALE